MQDQVLLKCWICYNISTNAPYNPDYNDWATGKLEDYGFPGGCVWVSVNLSSSHWIRPTYLSVLHFIYGEQGKHAPCGDNRHAPVSGTNVKGWQSRSSSVFPHSPDILQLPHYNLSGKCIRCVTWDHRQILEFFSQFGQNLELFTVACSCYSHEIEIFLPPRCEMWLESWRCLMIRL